MLGKSTRPSLTAALSHCRRRPGVTSRQRRFFGATQSVFQPPKSSSSAKNETTSVNKPTNEARTNNLANNRPLTYRVEGITIPPFTPMNSDRSVNVKLIPKYAEYLRSQGPSSIFALGSSGEGVALSVGERKKVLEEWMRQRDNGVLTAVSVHVGASDIEDAKELARHAEGLGVDAIASMPQLYFRPKNVHEVVRYLKEITQSAPNTPFVLYDHPLLTGIKLDMADFLRAGQDEIPQLCGVKYSDHDAHYALKACMVDPARHTIYWSRDDALLAGAAYGMRSFIGVSYNFASQIALKAIDAYTAGKVDEALEYQKVITNVVFECNKYGFPFNVMKLVTARASGIELGPNRPPLYAPKDEDQKKLFAKVDEFLKHAPK